MPTWQPAYVGLGSNLAGPYEQLEQAMAALKDLSQSRLVAQSALYESLPWGGVAQPNYMNAVVGMLTLHNAHEFLRLLLELETKQGRVRGERYGPRSLDLDLLLFGNEIHSSDALTLPHPRMHERNFVIYPLAEIAPTIQIGKLGSVAQIMGRLGNEGLIKICKLNRAT